MSRAHSLRFVTTVSVIALAIMASVPASFAQSAASAPASTQAPAPAQAAAAAPPASAPAITSETLLQTSKAWDGSTYVAYPQGTPQVSVLRITIPANTTMAWHSHPIPNVAYIVSGEITVEKQDGSAKDHFTKGQTIAEVVNVVHRGVTGAQPVELLVFYAGAPGVPLSKALTPQPAHP